MPGDPAAGVGLFAALWAGVVSFLSPCVLPLVPGYLSAVTGVKVNELGEVGWRQVLVPSLLFVASFSTIFILLGLTATGIGSTLNDPDNQDIIRKVAGGLIVLMGVVFVAAPFIPMLNREWHIDSLLERAGKGGPVVAGVAFGVAWTPCIGPTLSAILAAAALTDSAGRGAFLLAVYSAGLAIPFLLTALAFSKMTSAFAVVNRFYPVIIVTGGLILIAMGILIWTDEFFRLNIEVQQWMERLGLDFWSDV